MTNQVYSYIVIFLYIYLVHMVRPWIALRKFISQTKRLRPAILRNIKTYYRATNGRRTSMFPNRRCDLYIFDNYICIVQRYFFIFYGFPMIVTSDIVKARNTFDYLEIYKPDSINFEQNVAGEVELKMTDSKLRNKRNKIDLTLKELTNEEFSHLEKIKS